MYTKCKLKQAIKGNIVKENISIPVLSAWAELVFYTQGGAFFGGVSLLALT